MNLYNLKSKYLICFQKEELAKILEIHGKKEMDVEMKKQGVTFDDFTKNPEKMIQIVSAFTKKNSNDRDYHEIFSSVFVLRDFYPDGSEICFELKRNFDPKRDIIDSLDDLNKLREGTFTDFVFKLRNDLREFQLKRYRGKLNTEDMFKAISEVIKHYANDLGSTNLLLLLQSSDNTVNTTVFHELHEKLKGLNLTFTGMILVMYNENMKFSVINQIYPALTTSRIESRLPSQQN
jgi:hypothetical protein